MNNTIKIHEHKQISGRVTIDTFAAGMVNEVRPYLARLSTLRTLHGAHPQDAGIRAAINASKAKIAEIKDIRRIRTAAQISNLVMDSPNYGLDLIIQRLVGNNTYSLNILWIELGTGTTPPNVNDTGLTSPSIRIPVSYQEDYGATDAIVQAYITDTNLPNATYTEVGSFVDGDASIGTGQIFNHALVLPTYSKVGGQDTTIEIDFTVVNS